MNPTVLPLWPQGKHAIIDEVGNDVGKIKKATDRKYIIKAVNCHDKLVKALKKYGDHEPCCVKGEGCNCGFKQVLKEAEKQ